MEACSFICHCCNQKCNNTILLHCSMSFEAFLVAVDPSVFDHWIGRRWRSPVCHAFGDIQPRRLVCIKQSWC